MMLGAELLAEAKARLEPIFGADSQSDIRRIFEAILGQGFDPNAPLLDDQIADLQAAIAARCCHQPVAQIIGKRAFWDHEFIVTSDVLDPRPDSETLIEQAISGPEPKRILDLGTGSGCLLLTLLAHWSNAKGLGVDQSSGALNVAQKNAELLDLADRASFQQGDWCRGVVGEFDLIISNPPYIPTDVWAGLDRSVRDWEPKSALSSGATGLEAYEAILTGLPALAARDARVLFEIGFDQASAVIALINKSDFQDPICHKDINGKDRVVTFKAV